MDPPPDVIRKYRRQSILKPGVRFCSCPNGQDRVGEVPCFQYPHFRCPNTSATCNDSVFRYRGDKERVLTIDHNGMWQVADYLRQCRMNRAL